MDFSNFSHDGEHGFLTEQKESHWQPARRPDDDDEMDENAQEPSITSASEEKTTESLHHTRSRVSFSQHDEDQQSEDSELQRRLDPAWGIKRTDSAHILDTVHRTNSFPVPDRSAPPVSQPKHPEYPESSQQVWQSNDSNAIADELDEDDRQDNLLETAHEQEQHIERSQQAVPLEEDQNTPLYDEGVPLIGAQDSQSPIEEEQQITQQQNTVSAIDNTEAVADGFFSQQFEQPQFEVDHRLDMERKQAEEAKEKDLAAAFGAALDEHDDPWKAAMGDDDEFLVEDADDLLPDSDEEIDAAPAPLEMRPPPVPEKPRTMSFARSNSNPYTPHQPTTSEFSYFVPTSVGLPRQVQSPMAAFQNSQQQANITNRAESFVDQAKGGYKSPYDLPMDLAPKRKPQTQRTVSSVNTAPPPPRSSSINAEKQLQSPFTPSGPTFNQSVTASPAIPVVSPVERATSVPSKHAPATNKRSTSGFFEELPIASRPRPSAAAQRVQAHQTLAGPPRQKPTQNANFATSPPQIQDQAPQQPHNPYTQIQNQGPQKSHDPYAQFQPQPPAKNDLYANVPLQSNLAPAVPTLPSRYSPAPASAQNGVKPSPSPRYSPAPPSQSNAPPNRYVSQPVPPTSATLPFQPRTSSPLAQHRRSVDQGSDQTAQQRPGPYHSTSSSLPHAASFSPGVNGPPSPPRGIDPVKQQICAPPRRSQTGSPSRRMGKTGMSITPRIAPPPDRPASAFGQLSPVRAAPPSNLLSPPRTAPQVRQVEQIEYIRPNDETANDPLERWKGSPIFRFGFGGSVVTSFPRRTPRFSSAAARPQMKASSGEVKVKTYDSIVSSSEIISKFPGPLRGKAKKKDALSWLSTSIASFEARLMTGPGKRLEEKILLWKLVKVLVDQDGSLESTSAIQSISALLMPETYTSEEPVSAQFASGGASAGFYRPASAVARTETVDPAAVETLRKTLLKGRRQDAVWQAVDSRLWSHALLVASTLDKSIWRQVVQEFVKQEVKTIGANAESLCAFYEILGGNAEASVDQLVPPSARHGLQMVSKVEISGPIRNALDGLEKWKETLCLILNNRSFEDQKALFTLAGLLTEYGRVEAAHICYLFARSAVLPNLFGGADDANTCIVLLGADHRNQPLTFHHDTDSIMLSEVYEFAVSTLASGSTGAQMPHLAVYKLQRANQLTNMGMKTEAQAYCDAIAAGLKGNTKNSLYYHPLLLGEVEDLSNRLKQVPVTSASWMTKPSIEKVSGSVWNKFTNFVAGEDSDAESKGSARDAAEAGPFAKVSGSPTLSRNTSQTDLYGSYPTMTPAPAATSAGSRYAPNGMSSARSSSDMTRTRTSFDFQRSPPSTSHSNEPRNLYASAVQPQSQHSPLGMSSPVTGYQPNSDSYMPSVAEEITTSHQASTYTPDIPQMQTNGIPAQAPAFGGYSPTEPSPQPEQEPLFEQHSTFEPPQQSYGGYEPPADGGYIPYQPDAESDDDDSSSTKPQPKKKFFPGDVDGDFPRVSNTTGYSAPAPPSAGSNDDGDTAARKKANDEAAEAAFRAAAEADAARAKEQAVDKKGSGTGSGSWLGGWFGSKRSDSLDSTSSKPSSADKKVHRVHLGESKMKLYYDKEKGKWINPDNPEASEKKMVAPPPRSSSGSVPPGPPTGGPPMGGPPRSVSVTHTLPAASISRSGTPMSQAVDTESEGPHSRPGSSQINASSGIAAMLPPSTAQSLGLGLPTLPSTSAGPATGSTPATGPSSRPASALSNASGLDDLLGGPPSAGARKVSGRGVKGKKGRYVDVMAK